MTRLNVLPEEALTLLERKVAAAGLSRVQLAEQLGVATAQVDRWLTTPGPDLKWLLEVLELVGCKSSAFFAEVEALASVPVGAGEAAARPGPTGVPDPDARRLADELRRPLAEYRPDEGIVPTVCLGVINKLAAAVFSRRHLLSVGELKDFLEDVLRRFRDRFPLP